MYSCFTLEELVMSTSLKEHFIATLKSGETPIKKIVKPQKLKLILLTIGACLQVLKLGGFL